MRTPGVGSGTRRGGLTGYRYLLAVVVLVTLATVPMLVAVVAGAATLSEPPPAEVDATPFVTYSGPTASGCPSWPNQPQ